MARLRWIMDQAWHRARNMEFIPADVIEEETGTLDFDCSCWLCRWGRRG